jgi:hypothetical protein
MTALSKCISESYLLLLRIDVNAEDFSVSVSSGQQGSRPVAGKETDLKKGSARLIARLIARAWHRRPTG